MKSQGLGLEAYLREAAETGSRESEGVFTIAGAEAIRKLASFQLPRSSAWVLKVVQAAVAWGASRIEIKQTAHASFFGFHSKHAFDTDGLRRALLDPDAQEPRYLNHLATGLRAVGFADQRKFSVSVLAEDVESCFHWSEDGLRSEERPAAKIEGFLVRLRVDFPPQDQGRRLGGMARGAGRASDEYMELVERAEVCPIPLLFDGRRLDTLDAQTRKHKSGSVSRLGMFWAPPAAEMTIPLLRLPEGVDLSEPPLSVTDRFTDRRYFMVSGDLSQRETEAVIKLTYHYKVTSHRSKNSSFQFLSLNSHSKVHWILDGVICQSDNLLEMTRPTALDLYLSADGVATDISGLTLHSHDASLQQRILRGASLASPAIADLKAALTHHRSLPFGFHAALYGGVALLSVVLSPGLAGLLGAGLATGGLLGSASDKSEIVDDCQTALSALAEAVSYLGIRR